MRVKIMVATAIALAAIAFKKAALDSESPAAPPDPHAGALPDAPWPSESPDAESP